ncbi:MAG: peptide chain release factor N(5)-glutamine methyltransferase [Pseudomonadota bacterium]
MTWDQAIAAAARRLEEAGITDALREARLLARWAGELEATALLLCGDQPMEPAASARFETGVTARAARRPLAQITGERLFWGRSFRVTGDTLDPRPESETLIATALEHGAGRRVLDLGTGTGCLLLSLLAEWPGATGLGVDLSAAALAVATDNAARHGLTPRAAFQRSDWFSAVEGRFDVIVANPPYIAPSEVAALAPEVRLYEPRSALVPCDAPAADGLEAYRAIASGLGAHLAQGGSAFFEIGPSQGRAVAGIIAAALPCTVQVVPDLDGRDRVICVFCIKSAVMP